MPERFHNEQATVVQKPKGSTKHMKPIYVSCLQLGSPKMVSTLKVLRTSIDKKVKCCAMHATAAFSIAGLAKRLAALFCFSHDLIRIKMGWLGHSGVWRAWIEPLTSLLDFGCFLFICLQPHVCMISNLACALGHDWDSDTGQPSC